jgi:uncharacterized protein (TIRG00374 family)
MEKKKSVIVKYLKIVLPLGLGVFLIYWMFRNMTSDEYKSMIESFVSANYWWILLSMVLGLFSHISRAWRWKYMLNALGHNPKFKNSFFSVMIGYMVNLLVPRLGEISRVAYFSKYEKISFDKTLGTVIAERIADFILLISIMGITLVMQYDIIVENLGESMAFKILTNPLWLVVGIVALIVLAWLGFKILGLSNNKFIVKIRGFMEGIREGVLTIARMDKKIAFILHTIFIWVMYIAMFYVCFYCMDGLENVPFSGKLAGFVVGAMSIAATNGGLGAYPYFIAKVLVVYGVTEGVGSAFGWAVWTSQTAMLLFAGLISILLINLLNKNE